MTCVGDLGSCAALTHSGHLTLEGHAGETTQRDVTHTGLTKAEAGQIMRDLVLERETEFTELFFVNRGVIPLPPEPLRFALGESIRRALKAQDAWEARKGAGVA